MMTTPPTYENSTIGQRNYTRDDLEALTNEKAITLIPAMVVLGLMMIAGVVGNTLVCYIFGCRLKSGTQNFLIICLAVLDLLSCVIAIPNEIADMRFYFDFGSAGACKIMRFINTFCSIGSIFTLVVIAIDRYRKICKPFHGQLHMNHVRLSLIPIFGGAIFFAWPAFIMYGLRTTETEIAGLYGKDCSTPDAIGDTIYPLLYNCVLFLCFLILAATLIILYYFVLRETRRHNRYLKRNSDFNLPSSPQYNSEDSHSSVEAAPRNVTPSTAAHSYDEVVKKENFLSTVPMLQSTLPSRHHSQR
uniref:G-protein coupled receptors family 1 profile domain-containing protein n=2 Tax=Arion vulgaris TaxID=1028688 RepID=A0A0B7A4J0_9EUPU